MQPSLLDLLPERCPQEHFYFRIHNQELYNMFPSFLSIYLFILESLDLDISNRTPNFHISRIHHLSRVVLLQSTQGTRGKENKRNTISTGDQMAFSRTGTKMGGFRERNTRYGRSICVSKS